jgi:hypothetical protein
MTTICTTPTRRPRMILRVGEILRALRGANVMHAISRYELPGARPHGIRHWIPSLVTIRQLR